MADEKPEPICEFSLLAYQVLVVEKRALVRDVAQALNLSADALYSRLRGRSRFRPHEIRALVDHVDDQRLLRFFADDSRFVVARRPEGAVVDRDIRIAAATTLQEAADLMRVVARSLIDGPRLSHRERQAILNEVLECETAIANLRATIEAANDRSTAAGRSVDVSNG
ncbi:MAG: hypothetical protein HY859_17870 [Caulobacterales bacterium]|nr:hypothetical protein [Caulobacterales bacterium]